MNTIISEPNRIKNFPIMMYAIVMGMSGLTITYQKAHIWLDFPSFIGTILMYVTTAVFIVISISMLMYHKTNDIVVLGFSYIMVAVTTIIILIVIYETIKNITKQNVCIED